MILIPQRLFGQSGVTTLLRDGNVCILKKRLTEPVIEREGYISNHVVSIVLAGKQRIRTYDESLIEVGEGQVLFIPRGMYNITDLLPKGGAFESLLFYFDDSLIEQFLSTLKVQEVDRTNVPDFLKLGVVPSIQQFAQALIEIYSPSRLQHKSFLSLKILELLHLLNSLATEQRFANFLFRLTLPQKRNIKAFMQANYDKPLKVEDYAYLTGRSLSSFRRDFKNHFDLTPQQWLKTQRLQKAQQIMQKEPCTVSQVAHEVGYDNVSYFIKEFKAANGTSPKQYMLQIHRNHLS